MGIQIFMNRSVLISLIFFIFLLISCSSSNPVPEKDKWSNSVVEKFGSSTERIFYSSAKNSAEESSGQPVDEISGQPSMIITSDGALAISYYKFSTHDCKYAYWNGSSWDLSIIDDYYAGGGSSLKLNSIGNPCVSYLTHWDAGYTLRYASYNIGSWVTEEVSPGDAQGFSSLIFDIEGNPHISYGKGQGPRILTHAYWDGSSWKEETVDNSDGVAIGSCIGIDSSQVFHISYLIFSYRSEAWFVELKHAWKSSSSWETESICETSSLGGWDKSSLCIDSNNNLHIFTRMDKTNELTGFLDTYMFYVNNSSGIWEIENIGGGEMGSMALDSNGDPHICYYGDEGGLVYAYKKDSLWIKEIAAPDASLKSNPSIVLDLNDNPFIAYDDYVTDCLLVAFKTEL